MLQQMLGINSQTDILSMLMGMSMGPKKRLTLQQLAEMNKMYSYAHMASILMSRGLPLQYSQEKIENVNNSKYIELKKKVSADLQEAPLIAFQFYSHGYSSSMASNYDFEFANILFNYSYYSFFFIRSFFEIK